MNINLFTPKISSSTSVVSSNYSNLDNASFPNLKPIQKDTVSFSGKEKAAKNMAVYFEEIIAKGYEDNIPSYDIAAKRLNDMLKSIGDELSEFGVSFDAEYGEHSPVKKTASFMKKFKRRGETPLDRVRSSLYSKNIYDLSILTDKILPALLERGYVIHIPKVRGGVGKPDFDVRLDIPEEARSILPKELREVSSFKKQSSGYGDIQMRIIDTCASGGKKTPIELLIIPGRNTAYAKTNESEYVYNIVRALREELHISEVETPEIHSPARRIKDAVNIIKQQLNDYISKPLFTNAMSKDIYGEDPNLPVELSKQTCQVLSGLMEGIRNKAPKYYKEEIKKVKSDEYTKEIEKLIKNSVEFKERTDKTVSTEDIIAKRRELVSELEQHRREDNEVIRKAICNLQKTIEKYGVKD